MVVLHRVPEYDPGLRGGMRVLDDLVPEFFRLHLPVAFPVPAELELRVVDDGVHELVRNQYADVGVLHLDAPRVVLDRDEPLDIRVVHAHRQHEGAPAARLRDRVRAFAEEIHERGRAGGMVDRGVDRRAFRAQDGEIGADAAAGAVDHRRFRDTTVDAFEAVFLDRDHIAIGERGPAASVLAPRSVHDAASRDEPEVEEELQKSVVPVFLVFFNGGERFGDAVPHMHRPLLVVRKVLRP